MNHQLQQDAEHTHTCVVCKVTWTYLTERDVAMLTTVGDCLGRVERWRPCRRYGNRLCLGHDGRCEP